MQFRRSDYDVTNTVRVSSAADVRDAVQEAREAIAIGARPDNLPAGVVFQPIARSDLRFIGPLNTLALSQEQIQQPSADNWRDVPLILSEEGLARTRIERWLKRHGIRPKIYAQVSGNEAIVSMVSLGFGIGVVPQIVLDSSPLASRIKTYEIEPPLAPYDIGLFALEKRLKEPLVSAFWNRQLG